MFIMSDTMMFINEIRISDVQSPCKAAFRRRQSRKTSGCSTRGGDSGGGGGGGLQTRKPQSRAAWEQVLAAVAADASAKQEAARRLLTCTPVRSAKRRASRWRVDVPKPKRAGPLGGLGQWVPSAGSEGCPGDLGCRPPGGSSDQLCS